MSEAAPIEMVWADGVLRPINSTWAKRAAEQFTVGEVYSISDNPERSGQSHNHLFAIIHSAWRTLPEVLADQFPSEEHLRKYVTIKAGIYDRITHACASKAEAQRLRAAIEPLDEFALVLVKDAVVEVYRAKSLSYQAMGKADFQKAKDAIVQALADMLNVAPTALTNSVAA